MSFEVIAPFDGLVARLDAKVGSSINAGEIAVVIADTSSWIVATTDVNEIDVVKLNESQPVTVTLDAMPDLTLKGNVLTIGQSYSENQGDIVYEVTILLADRNPSLRWGMTAVVLFPGAKMPNYGNAPGVSRSPIRILRRMSRWLWYFF